MKPKNSPTPLVTISICSVLLGAAGCSGSEEMLSVAESDLATGLAPLYHLYHPGYPDHGYAATAADRQAALAAGYTELTTEATIASAPVQGTVPLYRFVKPNVDTLLSRAGPSSWWGGLLVSWGYQSQGIMGYVLPNPAPEVGAVPLFQLYHPGRVDHMYTPSASHKAGAIAAGFQDWGVLGYVLPYDGSAPNPDPEPPQTGRVTAADLQGRACLWLEAGTASQSTDYGLNRPIVMALRGHTPGAINMRTLHPWYIPFTNPMSAAQVRAWARATLAEAEVDGIALDHEGWTLQMGETILQILFDEANRAGKLFCDVPKMTLDPGGATIAGTSNFEQQVRLINRYTHCVSPWSYGMTGSEYLTMVNRWRASGYTKQIIPMGDAGNRPSYGGITRAEAVRTVHTLADNNLSFCLFTPHYDDGRVAAAMAQRYR